MPPSFSWQCKIGNTILFTATFSSTLLLLSMTFERFYSIIKPHKAASFNTVQRAKIAIASIVIFSFLYHIPHLFIKSDLHGQCVPYSGVIHKDYGKFYHLLTFTLSYILPYLFLIMMHSLIIHTLRMRSNLAMNISIVEGQGRTEGQENKLKSSERHVYITLLLVSFMFIILTLPASAFAVSLMANFDYSQT